MSRRPGGLIAAQKNLDRDPEHYHKIGRRGGLQAAANAKAAGLGRGFALMPRDKVVEAGKKGGAASRKTRNS